MPPKVYLESPPFGDFRAMPALGDGLASLKWITLVPRQSRTRAARGDGRHLHVRREQRTAADAARRPIGDGAPNGRCRRRGRRGAGATRCPHGRDRGLRAARRLGGSLPWPLRASGPASATTPRPEASAALARRARLGPRLAWSRRCAPRSSPAVTPGTEIVVDAGDLRPGLNLNMLGADGPGKSEASVGAVRLLRAVLRRVGAGLARRRADERDRGRPRHSQPGDRARRRARRLRRPAARARRRSRYSTRPGWRSRIWRSPRQRFTHGARAGSRLRRSSSEAVRWGPWGGSATARMPATLETPERGAPAPSHRALTSAQLRSTGGRPLPARRLAPGDRGAVRGHLPLLGRGGPAARGRDLHEPAEPRRHAVLLDLGLPAVTARSSPLA